MGFVNLAAVLAFWDVVLLVVFDVGAAGWGGTAGLGGVEASLFGGELLAEPGAEAHGNRNQATRPSMQWKGVSMFDSECKAGRGFAKVGLFTRCRVQDGMVVGS